LAVDKSILRHMCKLSLLISIFVILLFAGCNVENAQVEEKELDWLKPFSLAILGDYLNAGRRSQNPHGRTSLSEGWAASC
jgi:hypothetical protein